MLVAERECRGCGAEIAFARTERGHWIPLDVAPDPEGTIVLRGQHGLDPLAHVLRAGEETTEPRYRTHYATCPAGERFRRRRAA